MRWASTTLTASPSSNPARDDVEQPRDPLGVVCRCARRRRRAIRSSTVTTTRCDGNGSSADTQQARRRCRSRRRRHRPDGSAGRRCARRGRANTGATASRRAALSWLPAITTTGRVPLARQREQRVVHDALGLRRRRGGVEQVAGDEHDVDRLGLGDPGDLGQHGRVLVDARAPPADRLAHVPVGGVQELHQKPSNGSSGWSGRRGSAPASDARVAHAGNGNCTTIGIGTSGWLTTIVPGLMIVARWRCAAGRNPYSPRAASAASSRPTTRIARVGDDAPLDLARRLLGADEDDPERAAPLGDVEQDLLDRARPLPRRVLVELVEHDELQRAAPGPSAPCARTPCAG